jgi:hypothetical protein
MGWWEGEVEGEILCGGSFVGFLRGPAITFRAFSVLYRSNLLVSFGF